MLSRSDIVGDFVVSMHTNDELHQAHRRMVDLLRADRPIDATSQAPEWIVSDNPTSRYVSTYCVQHLRQGWDPDWETDEHAIQKWLGDYPQVQPPQITPLLLHLALCPLLQLRSTLVFVCCHDSSCFLCSRPLGRYRYCSFLGSWLRQGVTTSI